MLPEMWKCQSQDFPRGPLTWSNLRVTLNSVYNPFCTSVLSACSLCSCSMNKAEGTFTSNTCRFSCIKQQQSNWLFKRAKIPGWMVPVALGADVQSLHYCSMTQKLILFYDCGILVFFPLYSHWIHYSSYCCQLRLVIRSRYSKFRTTLLSRSSLMFHILF